jgi:inner membrane protein
MDTITHAALGACVGELVARKQIGKKALVIGAFAQLIPDIDFLAAFWMNPTDNLLAHRGFTHSILFGAIITVVLALAVKYWFPKLHMSAKSWMLFFGIEIGLHLFLDVMNNYGTGLFEPFSHYRVSFNTIFVADPLYSVWLAVAFIALMIYKNESVRRKLWVRTALALSTVYFIFCVFNKLFIGQALRNDLAQKNIAYENYFTTPTFFNNALWYIVVKDQNGYYTGYRSIFDTEKNIKLKFFPRNDSLINAIRKRDDVQKLLRFSQGYYTAEFWHDTLVFNDLRFGQIAPWKDTVSPRFAFHYYLSHPDENLLVVQRGRFAEWDAESVRLLLKRIQGD